MQNYKKMAIHPRLSRPISVGVFLPKNDKQGKKIVLTCFCKDETECHRSIIAGLLQGAGCNVVLDSGADYRKYYEEYKSNTQTKVTFE